MLSEDALPPLIGQSVEFLSTLDRISKAAGLDRPLLIIGERGTGKELMAARAHFLSNRWAENYISVNCAALSETLLESELFGHEAGAFTGATKRYIGRFERANKGTLFLDEIAGASLRVQEKVLRIVEYGEFERVGGTKTLRCDVRLIGATNLDLPKQVQAGKFRADLLDRLAFEVITLPPLRARWEDIPVLAQHFAQNITRETGQNPFGGFSMEAMEVLMTHHWPGNIRELKNVVERNTYHAHARNELKQTIVEDILLDPFSSPWRPDTSATIQTGNTKTGQEMNLPEPDLAKPFIEQTNRFERVLLRRAMRANQQHIGKSAKALDLSYDQMRHYLKKHKLLAKRKTDQPN